MKKKRVLAWAAKAPSGDMWSAYSTRHEAWASLMDIWQQKDDSVFRFIRKRLYREGWRVVRVELREVEK